MPHAQNRRRFSELRGTYFDGYVRNCTFGVLQRLNFAVQGEKAKEKRHSCEGS